MLGHTQAATTARYAHLDADLFRSASEVIGGRIAAAKGEAFKLECAPPSDSDIPYEIQIIREGPVQLTAQDLRKFIAACLCRDGG